jgi:hypothetical protein
MLKKRLSAPVQEGFILPHPGALASGKDKAA